MADIDKAKDKAYNGSVAGQALRSPFWSVEPHEKIHFCCCCLGRHFADCPISEQGQHPSPNVHSYSCITRCSDF